MWPVMSSLEPRWSPDAGPSSQRIRVERSSPSSSNTKKHQLLGPGCSAAPMAANEVVTAETFAEYPLQSGPQSHAPVPENRSVVQHTFRKQHACLRLVCDE